MLFNRMVNEPIELLLQILLSVKASPTLFDSHFMPIWNILSPYFFTLSRDMLYLNYTDVNHNDNNPSFKVFYYIILLLINIEQ